MFKTFFLILRWNFQRLVLTNGIIRMFDKSYTFSGKCEAVLMAIAAPVDTPIIPIPPGFT